MFVYTVKDGDGDLSTTTLTINLDQRDTVPDDSDDGERAALDTTAGLTVHRHGDGLEQRVRRETDSIKPSRRYAVR